jgi:hypothetical protein
MTTVTCNVCIDEGDLDTILANLETLKTNLANWIEAKEVAGEIEDVAMLGLSIQTSVGISMSSININENVSETLYVTQETFDNAAAVLIDFVSHLQ